tara:strand:- start:1324 stop:1434 length:111 start_codon:yes stop_codon:yes gene_type:complete
MPTVAGQKYSYTTRGQAAAKKAEARLKKKKKKKSTK